MVSYINRGKEYVPVNQKLFANTVHSFIGFRERGQEHFLNTDLLDKCKVLTQTDIRYIAEQAKAEKKSINKYLEDIGFNTYSNISQGKAPLLIDGTTFCECNLDSLLSWGDEGIYGYRMDLTNDYARKDRPMIWHFKEMLDMHGTMLINEKQGLYLVAFVGRDFVDHYALG